MKIFNDEKWSLNKFFLVMHFTDISQSIKAVEETFIEREYFVVLFPSSSSEKLSSSREYSCRSVILE